MNVASWLANENRKTCENCERSLSAEAFGEGIHFLRREEDEEACARCEVTNSRPLPSNEIVLDLYGALPPRFDSFSGLRVFSFGDVMGLFDLFEIYPELRSDYYQRLLFFHNQLSTAIHARREKKQAVNREAEAWKKGQGRGRFNRSVH